jgi:hypothetical protein
VQAGVRQGERQVDLRAHEARRLVGPVPAPRGRATVCHGVYVHACERACVRALRPARACARVSQRACAWVSGKEGTGERLRTQCARSGWRRCPDGRPVINAACNAARDMARRDRRSALALAVCRSGGSSRAFGGIPVRMGGTRASRGRARFVSGGMGNVLRRTSVRTLAHTGACTD